MDVTMHGIDLLRQCRYWYEHRRYEEPICDIVVLPLHSFSSEDEAMLRSIVENFELKIKKKSGDEVSHYLLALTKIRLGELEDALQLLEKALVLRPGYFEACLHAGKVLFVLNRHLEAREHLIRALDEKPGNFDALFFFGCVEFRLKKFEEALEYFRFCFEASPMNWCVLSNLGITHYQLRQYREAEKCFKQSALSNYGRFETVFNRALCLMMLQQYADAENTWKESLEFADGEEQKGMVIFNMALVAEKLNHFSESIRLNKSLLKTNPLHFKVFNNMGVVLCREGSFSGGDEFFRKALLIQPDSLLVLENRAIALLEDGRPLEAQKIFKRLELVKDSWDVVTAKNMFSFYATIEKYSRALQYWEVEFDEQAREPWVLNNLALAHWGAKQYVDALKLFDDACNVKADRTIFEFVLKNWILLFDSATFLVHEELETWKHFLFILSRHLIRDNQFEMAEKLLLRCIEVLGVSQAPFNVLNSLGYCLYRRNQYADAETYYTEALNRFAKHDRNVLSPEFYFRRGMCLKKLNRHEESYVCFEAVRVGNEQYPGLDFAFGDACVRLKKYSLALENLRLALQKQPDDEEVLVCLGMACVGVGRHDEAQKHFDSALRTKPNYPEALLEKGRLLFKLNNRKEAFAILKLSLIHYPKNKEIPTLLGEILIAQERYRDAIHYLKQVSRLDPHATNSWFRLSEAYWKLKNFEEARACLEKCVQIQSNFLPAYVLLSKMCMSEMEADKAILHLQTVLAHDPEHPEAILGLIRAHMVEGEYQLVREFCEKTESIVAFQSGEYQEARPEVLRCWGIALDESGNFREATTKFSEYLDLTQANDFDVFMRLGKIYLNLKLFRNAVWPFKKALQINSSKSFEASYWLGLACMEVGAHEDALKYFDVALKSNVYVKDAYARIMEIRMNRKEFAVAAKIGKEACALFPNDIVLLRLRGDCLLHLKRFDEAVGWFKDALALDPGDVGIRWFFGRSLFFTGKYEEALEQYEATRAQDIEHEEVSFSLGEVHVALGKWDDAIFELENFLKSNENRGDAWCLLGKSFFNKKDFVSASSSFVEAEQFMVLPLFALEQIGRSFMALKQWKKAEEYFLRLPTDVLESVDVLFALGVCVFEQGRYENAKMFFEKYIVLGESIPKDQEKIERAHLYLGLCYEHLRQFRMALLHTEKVWRGHYVNFPDRAKNDFSEQPRLPEQSFDMLTRLYRKTKILQEQTMRFERDVRHGQLADLFRTGIFSGVLDMRLAVRKFDALWQALHKNVVKSFGKEIADNVELSEQVKQLDVLEQAFGDVRDMVAESSRRCMALNRVLEKEKVRLDERDEVLMRDIRMMDDVIFAIVENLELFYSFPIRISKERSSSILFSDVPPKVGSLSWHSFFKMILHNMLDGFSDVFDRENKNGSVCVTVASEKTNVDVYWEFIVSVDSEVATNATGVESSFESWKFVSPMDEHLLREAMGLCFGSLTCRLMSKGIRCVVHVPKLT